MAAAASHCFRSIALLQAHARPQAERMKQCDERGRPHHPAHIATAQPQTLTLPRTDMLPAPQRRASQETPSRARERESERARERESERARERESERARERERASRSRQAFGARTSSSSEHTQPARSDPLTSPAQR
jgi:hypothetical protein